MAKKITIKTLYDKSIFFKKETADEIIVTVAPIDGDISEVEGDNIGFYNPNMSVSFTLKSIIEGVNIEESFKDFLADRVRKSQPTEIIATYENGHKERWVKGKIENILQEDD